MVEYNDFKADVSKTNKSYEPKVDYLNKITTTSSPDEEYGRIITYRNRKGAEYHRI